MERTKGHVAEEMREAVEWYRMYMRMSEGKPAGYMDGPLDKIVSKMKRLELEYKLLGAGNDRL